MNKYISFIILIFCCICSQRDTLIDSNFVDYIKFYSLPREMERIYAITSGEELIEWNKRGKTTSTSCRDTTITSKEDIDLFVREVNNLKKSKSRQSIDIRTLAIIHMNSGSEIHICFGSNCGTTKNDAFMKDNPILFKCIDDLIYSSHDSYYWADEMTLYILEHSQDE